MKLVWALVVLVGFVSGCRRGDDEAVTIRPEPTLTLPDAPSDPFGAPSAAYEQLRSVTESARTDDWDGNVDTLTKWIESQTLAVEQSLGLMKALRLGASDAYAVANGRIALVYEHIASTLTEAEAVVKDRELDHDWLGQQAVLWERANAFWARCARGCSLAGPYLDAWELRCETGERETAQRIEPVAHAPSPRQAE